MMASLPRLDRTLVMGIVNVTPDSFSDGGKHADPKSAIQHGLSLLDEGADILDVGGESTRPGAYPISEETELERVLAVVRALAEAGATVSVDTTRAAVAQKCVEVGATLINDISGGKSDPKMLKTVAALQVGFVVQHWRSAPRTMGAHAVYADVVVDVRREMAAQVNQALTAGIAADQLIIDPGLGFSKNSEHNWALLSHLDSFTELGCPLLIGVSRKRFLGELLSDSNGEARTVAQRDAASVALTALLAERGVWGVRTHQVREHRDAIAVVSKMVGSQNQQLR
ncbi:MAG: dihydropteroate synthase [Propionibacteriaceae bacterium]|nr:dihydropteroate synthase [Propionibacteriaceae bacterium]